VDRYSTRALLAAAVAALAVFVGACGSTTEPATTGGTTQQEQAPGEFDELTAEQVVAEIARQVPEATPSVVFTAATDPNDLLGRPNGYVSKASFTDTRIDQATLEGLEPGAVDFGGTVEVFEDEDAATKRMEYIQAVLGSDTPFGTEYDYVRGPVLLRVIGTLTPDQAAAYEAALDAIES